MDVVGKKILIYGKGKSGSSSAGLLTRMGARAILIDDHDLPLDPSLVAEATLMVLSPGVPPFAEGPQAVRAYDIPIIGEIELAYRLSKGTVFAITGTNGKTTTTSLVGAIMKDHDANTFVAGNIGDPYTDIADQTNEESHVVLEISSFQLETIDTFHPHVSAILNITEDHLNRHGTMEEYIRVKEEITRNQTPDDVCVLNYDDPVLRAFGERMKDRVRVCYFSSTCDVPDGMYIRDGKIIAGMIGGIPVIGTEELPIIGRHNHENAMAAIAMAIYGGIPVEEIASSCRAFRPVAHRIEPVGEVRGVRYYNDSKATNPDAAIKGIEAMDRPTFLIAGGYDKGSDYGPWIDAFGGRVKSLVLEGATREAIRDAAISHGFPSDAIVLCETMTDAMAYCTAHAVSGDAVLLSPACASWGEFTNFEERGETFRTYVQTLET